MTKARGPDGKFIKKPTAITAAASVIPSRAIDNLPRSPEGWQTRAWRLWRLLGIVHFPTSYKAKQVARLKWNVLINGEPLEPEQAEEAVKAVTSPLGTPEAARRIALNLEVAGQVWYARKSDQWNVWAATTSKLKEKLKGSDIVIEGIQPDPEEPDRPTSSIMAALGTAEQIRLMLALSRSQDRNRLAQRGILLVPKEGVFPAGDDFQSKLEEAMTAPIGDEYAPSSVVPLKVDYPAEYIEKWRHLKLDSDYDDKLMDRIESAVHQFAREIDMPVEVLLGNLDSNHWNAWLSSAENYSGHIEPLAVLTGQVFAEAMMEAAIDSAFAGSVIEVTPDPSQMLVARPSLEERFRAYEWGLVNGDFVRAGLGADEDDEMDDEEFERLLLLKGLAPEQVEEEPTDVQEAPAMLPPANGNGQPALAAAVSDDDKALDELARVLVALDQRLLGTLRGATALAVEAARERNDAEDIGVQDRIADQMGRLGRAWRREIGEAHGVLSDHGIDTSAPAWQEAADVSVDLLVDGVTAYVTETIERTDSEMPTLPTPLLRDVLAAAGGSRTATVAAIGGPAPSFADPQGFAIGVLTLKDLKTQDIEIVQWRFRYGQLTRTAPFLPHKAVDGQFMTADGYTRGGYAPGDHKGCECSTDPVFRKAKQPQEA